MKNRWLFPALASFVLLAAGMLWLAKRSDDVPAADGMSSRLAARPANGERKGPVPRAGSDGSVPAAHGPGHGATRTDPLPRERILEVIEDAAVTYDAAALPRIDPYLRHPSPDVREAARNGMITLGEAAAGPLLREAARHAIDPREATALLEAAEYVELPPANLVPRERRRPVGAPGPSHGGRSIE